MRFIFYFHIAVLALGLDVIQIDVGNAIEFTGDFNMPANWFVHPSKHGTAMALSLKDQAQKLQLAPIYAEQVLWIPGRGFEMTIIKALQLAHLRGTRVLSLSYGGGIPIPSEFLLLKQFAESDTVIVAAAGNNGGGRIYYPANYPNPCMISVGTLVNGVKASYSNDADTWIEYVPGDMPGTSASTARMGAVALAYRFAYPQHSCKEIVKIIKQTFGGRK